MAFVPSPQPLPGEFAGPLATARPRLGPFGARVLWFDTLGSTNDVALALAERDDPEGTVVVADAQSAGRGRLGRTWSSPAGAGLYVSVVLRPGAPMPILTLAAGVALARGILAATGLATHLKWPNDVYAGTRKLAGILGEAGASPRLGHFVVLGCGINVSDAPHAPEVASRATAIEPELGRRIDRGLLLAESLAAIAAAYADVRSGRVPAVLEAWRTLARPTMGRMVEWDGPDGLRTGTARDVDDTGALLVDTGQGRERVIAGVVRWR